MKTFVLTAGVWPTEEEARKKLWIFLESCKKFQIEPHLYGIGHGFPGYRHMMCEMQLEYLKSMVGKGYDTVLFSDGWDAFLARSLDTIEGKYREYGRPPVLVSAYFGLGNESDMSKYEDCFDQHIHYRFPNRGGYIGDLDAVIDGFEKMASCGDPTGDDCHLWYRGWKEKWFRPYLDYNCEIFQVSDENLAVGSNGERTRLINTYTETEPCVIHISGGYTDSATGKDDRLIPWAKAAGVIE